jgi:DNA-binding NarL/FixJ family response regulator
MDPKKPHEWAGEPKPGFSSVDANPITVLLAEDHNLVRKGFRRMIEDDPSLCVVGEAATGNEAVRMAIELKPRVVVMDYALPEFNGAEAARRILNHLPETCILMLSMHAEPAYVRNALDAGARGYILKNALDLDLADAVRRVASGVPVIDPALAGKDPGSIAKLTPREREVLQLIVEGKSNKEIASVLNLSVNTVAVHRANIMSELRIHNTAELVVYAIRNGLVGLP